MCNPNTMATVISTNWKYEERPEEPPLILGVGTNLGLGVASVWGKGLAPIHLAALHGRLDCLRLLVEKHKTDVNIASNNGWRPLHLCISNQTGQRSLKCLIYLLEHDADPDVINEDGVAPIHQAASEGHVQCLKVLIEIGAKIDVVDNRNHQPIDLAKLWSHKKCARILANEMWHKDKAQVAQDMNQLRKVKLQQVLRKLEDQDSLIDDGHFYGKEAYDDWVNKGDKKRKLTNEVKKSKKQTKPKIQFKESLHKPNSKSSEDEKTLAEQKDSVTTLDTDPVTTDTVRDESAQQEKKVVVATKDNTSDSRNKTPSTIKSELSNIDRGLYEITEELSYNKIHESEVEYNRIRWNYSTKLPITEYVTNLPDAYPRDVYTMMPLNNSTPKELNIRHNPKIFVTDDTERVKRADKEINLKRRVNETTTDSSNINIPDKIVLYKCKSVLDVETKRKTTLINLNECGLHLSNDINSPIFQSGLLVQPIVNRAASSNSSLSSSDTNITEQSFPRQHILSMLKNVTNNPPPMRLPPIDAE